jgi:D-arabinitol 4-dehydrogenase
MDEKVARGFFAAADPVKAYCADRLLWGRMAQTPQLENAVRAALARVDEWLDKRA